MSAPIDEIRGALEAHAQFEDTAALVRLGAVKARVRVVRRRRRAALAGAAAAVVAVVGGVATVLPGDHEAAPADRTFGHLTAPATMTSLGYTFGFARMLTGEDAISYEPDGDEPRLVSWAGAGSRAVELSGLEDAPFTSADDFDDFAVVSGDTEVKVTGTGDVALAVYTLVDRPAGETVDGITFRADRSGDRLVASAIGEPGDNDLTFTFTMPDRPVREVTYCSGVGRSYDVQVSLNGHFTSGGSCGDGPNFDGQFGSATWDDGIAWPDGTGLRPGDRVTARIWLTRHVKGKDHPELGPVATSDAVRLGLAYYEVAPTVAEVAGWRLPELYEFGGHVWRYVSSAEHRGGRASYDVAVAPGAPDRLVRVATRTENEEDTDATYRVSGGSTDGLHAGGSFMTEVGPVRSGSETVSVRRSGGGGAGDVIGFAVYERVD